VSHAIIVARTEAQRNFTRDECAAIVHASVTPMGTGPRRPRTASSRPSESSSEKHPDCQT
jgi:hypothetical protein